MKSVLFPTNFFEWPEIKNLLPDQKLIAAHLWVNRFVRPSGIYVLPLEMFAANLQIGVPAIITALEDFDTKNIIAWDQETGEIYFLAWLRFHTFKPLFLKQYFVDFENIQSAKVKKIFEEKTRLAGIKKPDTKPPAPAPAPSTVPKNNESEIDKIVEAAVWYSKRTAPGKVVDEIDFRKWARHNLVKRGIQAEDLEILEKYVADLECQAAKKIVEEAAAAAKEELATQKSMLRETTLQKLETFIPEKTTELRLEFVKFAMHSPALHHCQNIKNEDWDSPILYGAWLDWVVDKI